ncbi:SpoIIE family protein phosphatase [Streptomyces sp. 5-8]|uniref:SpoIIE family protein phosphatase n=1 Tax=Streptomyces musisoli TaxID=2802280 RepID=A0ABS1PE77_9ACTN|nr:SpoIIE family protein phosphatase [Streptomyces musisoli]MBL1110362.1 SpoIIE family protein phosphatase [Streptomyces musisoli]
MTGSRGELNPGFASAVLRDLGTGVFTTDTAGLITYVNPWAERLLRRPATQIVGHDAHDLLHRSPDGTLVPRERCLMLSPLTGSRDTVEGSEEYFLRSDGVLVPIIWSATPLLLEGRPDGLVIVFNDFSLHRDAEERAIAHTAALEALTGRLNLLAAVSSVLMSGMDATAAARKLLPLLVPELGHWASVDLIDAHSGILQRVAVRSPAHPNRARQLTGPLPLPAMQQGLEIIRGDQPVLVQPTDPGDAGVPLAASHRILFDRLGGRWATAIPIRSRRRYYGVLTVAQATKSPSEAEIRLLADIGRRLALVLDNSQLYEEQRNVAETMQRQLLAPLPQVDHLRMAARYLPAQHAMEIGGDWYDAFLVADGVMALVIGDVVGHDLQAAVHMAEVRNMLRALAWTHVKPPSLIMRQLDEAVTHTSDAPMATLIFACIEGPEGGPWQLHWVNAGHPPPLLITSDGATRFLTDGHGPLIGMSSTLHLGLTWPDALEELPPEATVLFYTDGLVESRERPIDAGMARLRHHASLLARQPHARTIDDFCDQLLQRLAPHGDDTALLALRLPPAGAGTSDDHSPPPPPQSANSPAAPERAAPGSLEEQSLVQDPTRDAHEALHQPDGPDRIKPHRIKPHLCCRARRAMVPVDLP